MIPSSIARGKTGRLGLNLKEGDFKGDPIPVNPKQQQPLQKRCCPHRQKSQETSNQREYLQKICISTQAAPAATLLKTTRRKMLAMCVPNDPHPVQVAGILQPFSPTSIRIDQSQPPLKVQVIIIFTSVGGLLCVNPQNRTVLLEKEHVQAHGGSFSRVSMEP